MESNLEDQREPESARDALDAIDGDRISVGSRVTAETWWAAPAQGLGTALLVAAPAAGFQWAWLLFLASTWVFLYVEVYFRKRSGLKISLPAGPRGLALLIGFSVVLVGAVGVNIVLAIMGQIAWILIIAAIAGALGWLTVVMYDRTYAAEVRRAR